MASKTLYPYARPLYVMTKPAGSRCNLACQYCYYLEKKQYYTKDDNHLFMSDEVLERFIQEYIQVQTSENIYFTWHGGEPLMRSLEFYKKVVRLQERYAQGHRIANCLQTNGTLLTKEWCKFLHDHGWLVGISIDGTQAMHDAYRTNRNGDASWSRVMKGIELLNRYKVEWNAMATIHQANVSDPMGFYTFFRNTLGCQYLQFTPIVEREIVQADHEEPRLAQVFDSNAKVTPQSVLPHQWGKFLCTLFDEWVTHDVGSLFVQLFDATLAGWVGVTPGVCCYAEECGHAAVMEYNGDLYSCDHFVFPSYRLGNIRTHTLPQMLYGAQQTHFSQLKKSMLPQQCRQCPWLKACHGECPRLRFTHTSSGEPGLNYLCMGYQMYFQHIAPYMDYMAQLWKQGIPASYIMSAIKRGEIK